MRQFDRYTRQFKRATVARSVFDWIALVCMGASLLFWITLHWAWLNPASLLSMQSIVAIVMGLIYSLVTPLLWSAMAPSTPAGMMLQRTQTRTWGFVAMLVATVFLTWHGWHLIFSWWMSQPNVTDTGEATNLAIACLIGFVLIPALAWTATTPEMWMAAVEQAHAVRKLEMQQRSELAIIKASLIRAETLAALGWANLLPREQEEVFGTVRGLLMGSADSMRSVVRTLGLSADLERSIMGDDEIADELERVAKAIDVVPDIAPLERQSAHVDTRPEPSIQQIAPDDGQRRATTGNDGYVTAARDHFGRTPWTIRALADALNIGETAAKEMRDTWLRSGIAKEARLGRWCLTESESA